MFYSLTEFPVIAAHIKEHQTFLPIHKTLHYLGPFRELANLNRRRAYGDLAYEPLDPVPQQGWSWDEYPFASTLEGGFGAIAGGIGTTVVAAPNTEQGKQAAKHTNFYLSNKLKPSDPFKVEVIP